MSLSPGTGTGTVLSVEPPMSPLPQVNTVPLGHIRMGASLAHATAASASTTEIGSLNLIVGRISSRSAFVGSLLRRIEVGVFLPAVDIRQFPISAAAKAGLAAAANAATPATMGAAIDVPQD